MSQNEDRRREHRHLCSGLAQILEYPTGAELGQGEIGDISPSGASVRIYCPLKPGSTIELRQDDAVYYGEIRYCIPDGPDFKIGVQLFPAHQWSPENKWPKLTDPASGEE